MRGDSIIRDPFFQHRLLSVSADSAAAAVSRSTVISVLAATTAAQVAAVMGTAIFPVIAPKLAVEMGVEPVVIGYQMSLIYGSAMVGSIFLNWMVGRMGGCRSNQVGLALCVAGMALALASNLWALVLASVLLGIAMSLMMPAATHLLHRFSPPRNRNLVFSLKQTGVPLGWTLVALFAPAITLAFGWRWSVALVLLIAAAVMIAMQPARAAWDDDRHAERAQPPRLFDGLALAWRTRPLRWLSLASLCLAWVQLCLGTFLVTMLVGEAGYSLVTAGLVLSCNQAAGVGGRVFWGWVADRTRDTLGVLIKVTYAIIACSVATMFLVPGWPVAVTTLLFVVFGATAVGWNGLYVAEVARMSPRGKVSIATGGAMVGNFAGILIGPAAFALTYGISGSYALTFGLLAVVAAVGVVFLKLCRSAVLAVARE